MKDVIKVKFLKDVYPLKENVEVIGAVKFKSGYMEKAQSRIVEDRKNDDSLKPHIIFLVDISYSMQGKRITDLKKSLKQLVDNGFLDGAYLSLVTFGEKSEVRLEYVNVEKSKKKINNVISALDAKEPQTYASRGFKKIDELLTLKRNGVNRIIYFTDGEDFDEDKAKKFAKKLVVSNQFTISAVGVGVQYNEFFLEEMATLGKGGFYHLNEIEKFFDDMVFDLKVINSEVLTNAQIVDLFYPSSVEPVEIFKIGNGVTELEIENNKILCGNLSSDDKIFFKFRIKNINTPGMYNILNATMTYQEGSEAKKEEFSFKVKLSNDDEALTAATADREVMDLNKQVVAFKKIKEAQSYFRDGKEKEARAAITEVEPIIKSLNPDDEISTILDDVKSGKAISAEVTRTLFSYTRTKTMTKTDTY